MALERVTSMTAGIDDVTPTSTVGTREHVAGQGAGYREG